MKSNYFLKIIPILVTCLFTNIALYAQPTAPEGVRWMVYDPLTDEFDEWNSAKWQKVLWDYPEPNKMKAENSGVSDGKLWILASVDQGNPDRWFETSRIYSTAKIKYPIYIECSMKTAHVSAYNTFWLNEGDANNRDEIDICENNSNPTDQDADLPYIRQSQYFIVKNGVAERSTLVNPEDTLDFTRVADFDNRNLADGNPAKGKKWNEEFQTFGLYWMNDTLMKFYINGEESGSDTSIWKFTKDLTVIWDLWTRDGDGGMAIKDSVLAQHDTINTMYIDWVHTYKLELEPPGDNTFIITDSSSTVESSSNLSVSVNYLTTEDLELIAELYDPSDKFLYNDLEMATEGFNKATLTISPDSSLPVADGYTLDISLRPIGDSDSICYSESYKVNVIADPVSSVASSNFSHLQIYPNPAQNSVTLTGLNEFNYGTEILIYSIEGKTILTKQLTNSQSKVDIDISDLSSGIYFIKIKGYPNSGTKFIKR